PGRTVSVAFEPEFLANSLATSSAAGSGTRIADLETDAMLAIGPVELGQPDKKTTRYDLVLIRAGQEWQLQMSNVAPISAVGHAPWPVTDGRRPAQSLSAALSQNDSDTAQLILRWGEYEATASVRFLARLRRPPSGATAPNKVVSRKHSEDTT